MTKDQLAQMIDHTYLRMDGNDDGVLRACYEAMYYNFTSVALLPTMIPLAVKILEESPVKVDAALSFFRGRYPLELKMFEVEDSIKMGAEELDIVISVNLLKEKKYDLLEKEFSEFVRVANGLTTKVILETCLLTDDEKITACKIARDTGVSFVKTSTGFKSGATVHDVALMRKTVGDVCGVKASGGIRNWKQAKVLIDAGANRLGVSAGVSIMKEFLKETGQ
ncbi:MAG: deoxyribose-phosphate aldolase [Firmicutes bacterium]|nr:deoxyribose-phosphate aldolase [Bacillota bacterium]